MDLKVFKNDINRRLHYGDVSENQLHAAIKMFHTLKSLKQSFRYTDDDDNDDVLFSIKIIHMLEM